MVHMDMEWLDENLPFFIYQCLEIWFWIRKIISLQNKLSKSYGHMVDTFTSPEGIVISLYIGCRFVRYVKTSRNKWLVSIGETINYELYMNLFYQTILFSEQNGISYWFFQYLIWLSLFIYFYEFVYLVIYFN